jgi:large conductance mechanosensitive channel
MKKFFEEFKAFISKGNVLDMAVGVIVGGAFGAITSSLVANVITPLLAWLFGTPNTDALNITLRAADEAAGTEALVLGLGTFVGAIINFLVIALVLFSVIKAFNKARELAEAKKKAEEEAAAAAAEPEEPKPTTEELLTAILEEMKKK